MILEKFTPVQQCMLSILADGLPHTRAELHACLSDELGPLRNICVHLSRIRKVLRPAGQDIVCELYRRTICYRHVYLLAQKMLSVNSLR